MTTWKKMYFEMKEIAGEALYLADAYAGGDSETANELKNSFDNIEAQEIDDDREEG